MQVLGSAVHVCMGQTF